MNSKPTATCAGCLKGFRTSAAGRMMRHGFRALNIRHNQHTGFHTGSCVGTGCQPLGTRYGNDLALDLANRHDAEAARLEGLPELTIEDATADQIRNAQASALRRVQRPTDDQRAKYSTVEAFRGTSWSGWFLPGAIEYHLSDMKRRRADSIAAHRESAEAYRAAVSEHPAP